MHPLASWQPGQIIGVFTDIDDTLTTEGAITPDALQALADLKAAGLHVVPITGRPVGWSEAFAVRWPVDAIEPKTAQWVCNTALLKACASCTSKTHPPATPTSSACSRC